MNNSIDYEIFLDDAIKEFDRLKKVYEGLQADQDMPVMHISDTAFLKYLNTTSVPIWARILHGNAYDHMRATFRALKVVNYDRKDFYSLAVEDTKKQKALYLEKHKLMVESLERLNTYMQEETTEKLNNADITSKQIKEDFENRVRAFLALADDIPVTKEHIISYYKKKGD